jgi:undecaprenyl-diphosphatase
VVVSAAIAVAAASFSVVAAPVVRWATTTIGLFTIVGVLGAEVSLASRVMALLAGGAMGAIAALLFGTATRRVARAELADAMAAIGLPVTALERHDGDARGSQPWIATLATGRDVFVKVAAVDELRSDQLFRFWRRVRLRRADDERSAASVRRAVEHEAFVSERAAAAGVSAPRVITIGELGDQRGMFLVSAALDGATLAEASEPSDGLLRNTWSQVQMLRRARIAHRDLRAANVMVGGDEAWLIDFGFAEVAANEDLLDRDLAEMLVSTAALVGIDRAVNNAVAVLGPDEFEGAIGWIQPLAVSSASRAALSRGEFDELREAVRATSGVSAPELPQLQRVSRKAVVATVALGLAIWTILPQLTKGIDWGTVLHAHLGWAGAALVASALTYVGAAISLRGSVTDPVPLPTTFLAQIASSFTNRITPAKVGGMALNVRFLTKQGIGTAPATTGVAVSTAAGTVVHVLLTVVAVTWAGNAGLPGVHAPSMSVVAIVLAGVVVAAAVVGGVPRLRGWAKDAAIPSLRRSLRSLVEVMRTPRNVVMLLGGSALVTVANLIAFGVSLRAFDITLPVSTIAVVYLAASALASAAPTPGGLGATEAALVAGLAVVSVHERMAIPAVLLFRLATFWVPILPGWIAMTVLQRRDDL